MDCSSYSSPGRWNHRLSFPSNFFGMSIRLDFIETLKIRLNGPHNSLFDPAFPYLKNSPSSWMDLIVFPFIFSVSCKRTGRTTLRSAEVLFEPAIDAHFSASAQSDHAYWNSQIKMASTEEVLVWTPELEVSLFHSMKGHKPVGESEFWFQVVPL